MSYAILAIASPADGLGNLRRICTALPQQLPVPVVCLQQFVPGVGVEDIIPRSSSLCARHAVDGERIEPGCVMFSPPGRGLLVTPERRIAIAERNPGPGTVARMLSPLGPNSRANGPADHFLQSVANAYGASALVLILGGWGADGLEGGHAIHDAGGTLIVQARDGMPFRDATQMLARAHIADASLDPAHIAPALTRRIFGESRPDGAARPGFQTR